MVECPFCRGMLLNDADLQIHLVTGCDAAEKGKRLQSSDASGGGLLSEPDTELAELEMVEMQFRWMNSLGTTEPEIYLISSQAGSIPLLRDVLESENFYTSGLCLVAAGPHYCQLVVGEDIHETKTIDIDPMTGIADVLLLEDLGTQEEQLLEENEKSEAEKDDEEISISPLHKELIAHQVVHGEPTWVPKEGSASTSGASSLTPEGPFSASHYATSRPDRQTYSDGTGYDFENIQDLQDVPRKRSEESMLNGDASSDAGVEDTYDGVHSTDMRASLGSMSFVDKDDDDLYLPSTPLDALADDRLDDIGVAMGSEAEEQTAVKLGRNNEALSFNNQEKSSRELELENELKAITCRCEKLQEENDSINMAHKLREEDLEKMNHDLEDQIRRFKEKFKDLEVRLEADNRFTARENAILKEQNEYKDKKIKALLDENAELHANIKELRRRSQKYKEIVTPDSGRGIAIDDLNSSSDDSPSSGYVKSYVDYRVGVNDEEPRVHRSDKYGSTQTDQESISDFYSPRIARRVDLNGNYIQSSKTSFNRHSNSYPEYTKSSDFPVIRKSLFEQPFEHNRYIPKKSRETARSIESAKTREFFKDYQSKPYDYSSYSTKLSGDDRVTKDSGTNGLYTHSGARTKKERSHSYHENSLLSQSVFNDDISLQSSPLFSDRQLLSEGKATKGSRSYSSGIDKLGQESSKGLSSWSFSKQPLKPFAPSSPSSIKVGMPITVLRTKGGVTRGVVKWSGYLPGHRESYVGVELATNSGLNDGVVNGIRYFHSKPGYGLFVPFSKILMLWDYGSAET